MMEVPPSLHDMEQVRKAWDLVLNPERPFQHFFIPIGRAPDLDADLYVYTGAGIYSHGVFGGPKDAWIGYVWAQGVQLLTALFPSRAWTEEEVELMSMDLWVRSFGTTRNKVGDVDDKPDMSIPLFRPSNYDNGQYEEHTGCGFLIPCDGHNLPRIVSYVERRYGLAVRNRKAVADELNRMVDINTQTLKDFMSLRSERDSLLRQVKSQSQQIHNQETFYTPLTILYIFLSLMTIGILILSHFR